jgi:DNA-binding transcriptional MerR regulator
MGAPSKIPRYSIGEAGKRTGLEPHVLRFWESEFEQLSPAKRVSGRRIYSDHDLEVIGNIKNLLYDRKFTIEGAKAALSGDSTSDGQTEMPLGGNDIRETIAEVKKGLQEILDMLD